MSDPEHYAQWKHKPPKFCSACGTRQSYEQFNFDKDCQCGSGTWIACPNCATRDAEIAALKVERDKAIHQSEHGTDKAAADADLIVANLNADADMAIQAAVDALSQKILAITQRMVMSADTTIRALALEIIAAVASGQPVEEPRG